ncbi:hypothetical protein C8R45DRAFT_1164269 [Mycena sanguinolenta]|nr:hypothetical protein C8R45DRAFT_1164269 [Mycena sanguinolenta]
MTRDSSQCTNRIQLPRLCRDIHRRKMQPPIQILCLAPIQQLRHDLPVPRLVKLIRQHAVELRQVLDNAEDDLQEGREVRGNMHEGCGKVAQLQMVSNGGLGDLVAVPKTGKVVKEEEIVYPVFTNALSRVFFDQNLKRAQGDSDALSLVTTGDDTYSYLQQILQGVPQPLSPTEARILSSLQTSLGAALPVPPAASLGNPLPTPPSSNVVMDRLTRRLSQTAACSTLPHPGTVNPSKLGAAESSTPSSSQSPLPDHFSLEDEHMLQSATSPGLLSPRVSHLVDLSLLVAYGFIARRLPQRRGLPFAFPAHPSFKKKLVGGGAGGGAGGGRRGKREAHAKPPCKRKGDAKRVGRASDVGVMDCEDPQCNVCGDGSDGGQEAAHDDEGEGESDVEEEHGKKKSRKKAKGKGKQKPKAKYVTTGSGPPLTENASALLGKMVAKIFLSTTRAALDVSLDSLGPSVHPSTSKNGSKDLSAVVEQLDTLENSQQQISILDHVQPRPIGHPRSQASPNPIT